MRNCFGKMLNGVKPLSSATGRKQRVVNYRAFNVWSYEMLKDTNLRYIIWNLCWHMGYSFRFWIPTLLKVLWHVRPFPFYQYFTMYSTTHLHNWIQCISLIQYFMVNQIYQYLFCTCVYVISMIVFIDVHCD